MLREELIFVATCDISGQVRGKAFPAQELPSRLRKGVGWTPTNLMISALGPIWDTPFGTAGDLMLVPDPWTEARVDFGDGSAPEHFYLGDLRTLDGTPWDCCPREFLRRAVASLARQGYGLIAAFEQEFVYTGIDEVPGAPYSLSAFRRQGVFGEMLTAAMRAAGVTPDSFLPEYGARQFEVTAAPAPPLRAADHAVITREMVRAAAFRLGHRVIFAPMLDPAGTGNGVHIHMSLRDAANKPATYAADEPYGLSAAARHFFAGVLTHLPGLCAITAPSPVSYLRLTPNRWAPTRADIAIRDRGASLRVCPVFAAADAAETARQYNVEFRPADAAASPYMALGAIIFAGTDGLARGLELPPGPSSNAPDLAGVKALPKSLDEALDALEGTSAAREWLGSMLFDAYLRAKRAEAANTRDWDPAILCARYADAY
ncbi:MAG TPA: glutamine synthetase family protein [Candidatus Binataceae bacterium]|nr:glutamine synthetase family protein [Candidatus Binataceae bacterium]